MQCTEPQCSGEVKEGRCQACGTAVPAVSVSTAGGERATARSAARLQEVTASIQAMSEASEVERSKEDLVRAADMLKTIVLDNYEAWRAQADLWTAAIRQLETRELSADDSVTLMGVPLREADLRDAAEEALRQCAHFAPTIERRIELVDEANSVRRTSWF